MDPTDEVKLRRRRCRCRLAMNKEGLRKLATLGQLSVLVPPGTTRCEAVAAGRRAQRKLTVRKTRTRPAQTTTVRTQTTT